MVLYIQGLLALLGGAAKAAGAAAAAGAKAAGAGLAKGAVAAGPSAAGAAAQATLKGMGASATQSLGTTLGQIAQGAQQGLQSGFGLGTGSGSGRVGAATKIIGYYKKFVPPEAQAEEFPLAPASGGDPLTANLQRDPGAALQARRRRLLDQRLALLMGGKP